MNSQTRQFTVLIIAIFTLLTYALCPILSEAKLLNLDDGTGWCILQNFNDTIKIADNMDEIIGGYLVTISFFFIVPTIGGILAVCGGLFRKYSLARGGSVISILGLIAAVIALWMMGMAVHTKTYPNQDPNAGKLFENVLKQLAWGYWLPFIGFFVTAIFAKNE